MTPTHDLTWRKASYSDATQSCVELATPDGDVALMRDSKHPDAGHLTFSRSEVAALVAAAKAGELDDLA
jgi:hypothetical protein